MKNLLNKQSKRSRIIKHLKRWKVYLAVSIFVSIFVYIVALGTIQFARQLFSMKAYAPTHIVYAQAKEKTPTEREQIDSYIREVFGDDADKAFQLLDCENHAHNPNAVNTAGNIPEGSRDIGIFQINEFHQNVNSKFLFDWRINIQLAHKIYTDSGNTFKMWTCGRRLSI